MDNVVVQIIVCTHGDLACSLIRTVELIAGKQVGLTCLAVMPGDDLRLVNAALEEGVVSGRPTLVLVDMLGGTPWNVAVEVAAQHMSMRLVSGVNLPMLLEVALSRDTVGVEELAHLALETGRDSMQMPSGLVP